LLKKLSPLTQVVRIFLVHYDAPAVYRRSLVQISLGALDVLETIPLLAQNFLAVIDVVEV
jgi:hypothetical protein